MKSSRYFGGISIAITLSLSVLIFRSVPRSGEDRTSTKLGVEEAYGQLPLSFEANTGHSDAADNFVLRGNGYRLFLTATEAVLILHSPPASTEKVQNVSGNVLQIKHARANTMAKVEGLEKLPGKTNYFIGNDPRKWRTNVPTYAAVKVHELYPGVDLVYHGNQGELESDFVVAPGADPERIIVRFQGSDKVRVDAQGNLVVQTGDAEIVQKKPFIYQEVGGVRKQIPGGYLIKERDEVGFEISAYDRSRQLIIDPVLIYSTYLGGSDLNPDIGFGIAVDAAGSAYVTGETPSTDFPTTPGAFQTTFGGSVNDVFVTKLNPAGSAVIYSTYLGGNFDEELSRIAVDAAGNAYVTGHTASTNFPTTAGAFQTVVGGFSDAFVTKLDPSGSFLVYSSYLGGNGIERSGGIAVDSSGSAYVTGTTSSTNFPITAGALQTTFAGGPTQTDAFVTKLNSSGSTLVYSSYIGGNDFDDGNAVAIDAAGNAYVTGLTDSTNFPTTPGAFQSTLGGAPDAFVSKLNSSGSALVYSTYLGGSTLDEGIGIRVDAAGNAYVTGEAGSSNFPTTPGAFQPTSGGGTDAFVTKLNSSGSALTYSTYLGGATLDVGLAIAVDTAGNAHVAGFTQSANFPTTAGSFQTTFGGGLTDAFVTKLNSSGSALVYSSYLGGSGTSQNDGASGIALDASGNAYVTGLTPSTDFPITTGAFQTTYGGGSSDAFVAKISPLSTTTVVLTSSANPSVVGQSVTFTATVSSSSSGTPTGTVIFRDGSTLLATTTLISSQAMFTTSSLALGSHSITAEYGGDANFFGSIGSLTQQVTYGVCVLYDQTQSVQSGATIPIKIELCDADGNNLSSPAIVVTATAVINSSNVASPVEDAGNANPDNKFRFEGGPGSSGRYMFDLKTTGLPEGMYRLEFTAGNDPIKHSVNFGVK